MSPATWKWLDRIAVGAIVVSTTLFLAVNIEDLTGLDLGVVVRGFRTAFYPPISRFFLWMAVFGGIRVWVYLRLREKTGGTNPPIEGSP